MKKKLLSILVLGGFILAAGCSGDYSATRSAGKAKGVNEVLESGIAAYDAVTESSWMPETTTTYLPSVSELAVNSAEGIDIDLTQLSSTMVYSEVYSMVTMPEEFKGKTVKMSGFFSTVYDESVDKRYFACIIQDATACCSQGIEFILTDDYVYPDDYPKEGEEISVVGTFDSYNEGELTYCTLKNAKMV